MPLEDITRRQITNLLEDMVAAGKRGMGEQPPRGSRGRWNARANSRAGLWLPHG
jgi:hypothetical protein